MGFLHRDEHAGATRYRMREKMFAIGEDFWIETKDGENAFKVDGKALRLRDTFILKDANGDDLFTAQAKKLHIHDTMKIERRGDTVATIKKALITPLRDRFSIELADGTERDRDAVAEVSRRWFRIRDTYGIEIAPGQEDALILAVTACIDEMEER
jgi:uncharacterized protein YxjI